MDSRERVKRAINFEKPDRIPIMHSWLWAAMLKYGEDLIALFKEFPDDFVVGEYSMELPKQWTQGEYVDDFGCIWYISKEEEGTVGVPRGYPLADWENFKSYEFPPVTANSVYGTFEQWKTDAIKRRKAKKYVLADFLPTFERMYLLRGYEALLMDIADGKEEVLLLRDKVVEWNLARIELWLSEDIDGIYFSDDWGNQRQLAINPSVWREIFKPIYRQMFEPIRQAGKDVFLHSDGYIVDIIDDLIEVGLNVINPQFACIPPEEVSEKFGGRITILTDIDRYKTLPRGTPEEVHKYVKRVIDLFREFNGGIIGRGEIGGDVPLENGRAMLQTFWEYGRYS